MFLSSCFRPSRLDEALEYAGANRQELEKVLVHYQDSGIPQKHREDDITSVYADFLINSRLC